MGERKNPYRRVWQGFGIGSAVLLLAWSIPTGISLVAGQAFIAKAIAGVGGLIHLYLFIRITMDQLQYRHRRDSHSEQDSTTGHQPHH